jgi:hypothetical protein
MVTSAAYISSPNEDTSSLNAVASPALLLLRLALSKPTAAGRVVLFCTKTPAG